METNSSCGLEKVLFSLIILLVNLASGQKLLLIITEGFAGSYYFPYSHLPAFQFFEKNGVWTDFLYPVFPSLSIPNQYTIVTGKYPVRHGITSDYMYDSWKHKYFMAGTRPADYNDTWWTKNKTEPIWVTATKARVPCALFYFPGCQVKFTPSASLCVPATRGSQDATLNSINIQDVLAATKVYDFVLAYHDEIQAASEFLGPETVKRGNVSALLDFAEIVDKIIEEAERRIDLNVVIMSDHGITDVSEKETRRFLDDYMDMGMIKMTVGHGAFKQIIPQPGKANKIFNILRRNNPIPNVKVYYTTPRMSDLPKWYHYRESDTVPKLLLVAKPGYSIHTRDKAKQIPIPSTSNFRLGLSGYNNHHPDMLGVFLAYGPNFQRGKRKSAVRIVDVYSIFCQILSINCPAGDGNFENLKDVLLVSSASNFNARFSLIMLSVLFVSQFYNHR